MNRSPRPVKLVRAAHPGQTLGSALRFTDREWRKQSIHTVANSIALEGQSVPLRTLIRLADAVYRRQN